MNSLRKTCLVGGAALLLGAATSATTFAQLREQPELLRRLWPFGREQQPVPLASQPAKVAKRPLIAPFVPRKIDINSCMLQQLQDLPGVGPGMAAHIMAGRPYRDFQDLERDGVPLNVVGGLRGVITFGP
ncbi:MAG: helix-hairpin-helix domain-containing protein [Pirellulales bacterium]